MSQLRSAVSQYESLTSEYKSQLEKYRKENDDLQDQMRVREKDTQKKLKQSVTEVEEVSWDCSVFVYGQSTKH